MVGRKRDGRCRYDPQAKRELIEKALVPGVPWRGWRCGTGSTPIFCGPWRHERVASLGLGTLEFGMDGADQRASSSVDLSDRSPKALCFVDLLAPLQLGQIYQAWRGF